MITTRSFYLFFGLMIAFAGGCNSSSSSTTTVFELLSADVTNIHFANDLRMSQEQNIYRYRNFYNGGGVGLGDVNQDGLIDIYFTANMGPNKLYLNKGGLQFEDVTEQAGVAGRRKWTTGVTIADVNGDGRLDIYVCNSGTMPNDDRKNELFINNGDGTYTEQAAHFGLDNAGMSIHASFFDYDRDGDLDLYLVNNSVRMIGSFTQDARLRTTRNAVGGDRLFENRDSTFVDVSEQAGIYGSEINFGLGVSVADFNRDNWPDMYISNDFFERDYLYINQQDGTFAEVLEQQIPSTSATSMGADVGDLNADGYPEIFVTDMLPRAEQRLKSMITFDSWERYQRMLQSGFHHQFTRNTLQLNNGNGTFSEIGRYAGVEATDWSWGANMADFNLDGRRDLFVANGVYHDITNIDYLKYANRSDTRQTIIRDSTVNFLGLIENIPSTPIPNYTFKNTGQLQFKEVGQAWGLGQSTFSNGSAYADLDNDGDLELVLNNLNSTASVYKNTAAETDSTHWLEINFAGQNPNKFAVGASATAWANGRQWYAQLIPARGYQSSVGHRLHFGLGSVSQLDSLIIEWPGGGRSQQHKVPTNQLINIQRGDVKPIPIAYGDSSSSSSPLLTNRTDAIGVEWIHKEQPFNDFRRDELLFHMRTSEGPPVCVGDVNNDGRDDFFAGGGRGQPGALFLQQVNGSFQKSNTAVFAKAAESEDTACSWFDANGDGLDDLYVGSGSNEFSASSAALADRLYINQGGGQLQSKALGVPAWRYKTAGTVAPHDIDGDGDLDLFLGIRLQPFGFGLPPKSYVLINDGNANFSDETNRLAPALNDAGMITDAIWADVTGNDKAELIIAGEWMPIRIFENKKGSLSPLDDAFNKSTTGWWNTITAGDFDGDGDTDLLAGNLGLNSRIKASADKPLEIYIDDFDGNGTVEQVLAGYRGDSLYTYSLKHDLEQQLPFIKTNFPDYASFAGQPLQQLFSKQQLEKSHHISVKQLQSVIAWNNGRGQFSITPLPYPAQFSPINAFYSWKNAAGSASTIVAAGNMHHVKPEIGRYDASYGTFMHVQDDTSNIITNKKASLTLKGEVRSITTIKSVKFGEMLIVGRNNNRLQLYSVLD